MVMKKVICLFLPLTFTNIVHATLNQAIDPDLFVKATPEMDPTVARNWAKLINAYIGHPDYETVNNVDSLTYSILLQSIQKQQPLLPLVWVIPPYFNRLKSELNSYSLRLGTAITSGLNLTVLDKAAAMEKLIKLRPLNTSLGNP